MHSGAWGRLLSVGPRLARPPGGSWLPPGFSQQLQWCVAEGSREVRQAAGSPPSRPPRPSVSAAGGERLIHWKEWGPHVLLCVLWGRGDGNGACTPGVQLGGRGE